MEHVRVRIRLERALQAKHGVGWRRVNLGKQGVERDMELPGSGRVDLSLSVHGYLPDITLNVTLSIR